MTGQLVQYGRHRQRRSYARISEVLELPNLIEIQTASYQWFLDEGLREMFQDISPIDDFTGNLSLEFIDYSLGEPKYSVGESKERDVTYAAPLRVKVRLINKVFFHSNFLAIKSLSSNGTSGAAATNTQMIVLYFHLKAAR